MKKIALLLVFTNLVFSIQSQSSLPVIENLPNALYIGDTIVKEETKNDTTPIDSTTEVSKETKKVAVLDTQRMIPLHTAKVPIAEEETKITNVLIPTLLPKTETKKREAVAPLGDIIAFSNVFWSLIILIGTYFFIKILVTIIERFAEKSTNYRITLKSLSPFVRIIGWMVAIIWIIEGVFELSNDKLFAFLASAGLAIGFASQDILKNIFGGIMILLDKPFQVGDKIEVGAIYGEVKEIGLRSTRILTNDDSLVSVPNAEVVNSAVSNSNTGEANCQVVAEIYLPIDTDTNVARLIATEAAQVSRFIYLNKPITVLFFNEVKEDRSYYKMRVKAYVSDIRNEFAFKSDMTEIIMKEFLKQSIFKKQDVQ
ncbi:MAG: MscS family membrane protein [Vicingaceae bacterium]|jgi:small-conductance mechanosensitive channel